MAMNLQNYQSGIIWRGSIAKSPSERNEEEQMCIRDRIHSCRLAKGRPFYFYIVQKMLFSYAREAVVLLR